MLVPDSCQAILFDLSGVIYEGDQLIPGADQAVQRAREQDVIIRFVTNTATKPEQAIIDKLTHMGITVNEGELITAPQAAKQYLTERNLRPYCLVHPAIAEQFEDLAQPPYNAVLLGDAREELSYENLNKAFNLCKEGHPLIGIGRNKYFKDEEGLKLDAGGFILALEWAADVEAVIMGKPSIDFFNAVVQDTGVPAEQCLMIGDDLLGDVKGARDAGLQACLVRTGKFQPDDEKQLPEGAMIVDDVLKLFSD